jgi:hypothetical protein
MTPISSNLDPATLPNRTVRTLAARPLAGNGVLRRRFYMAIAA